MNHSSARVIRVKQTQPDHWISVLATVFSVLLIVIGALGLVLIQRPLQQTTESRSSASVVNGQVVTTFANGFMGQESDNQGLINISVNTNNLRIDGVEYVLKLKTDITDDLEIVPYTTTGSLVTLTPFTQEVERTSDGFLVHLLLLPNDITAGYTGSNQIVARIQFPIQKSGRIEVIPDANLSFATVSNANPPRDELSFAQATTTLNYNKYGDQLNDDTTDDTTDDKSTKTTTLKSCNQSCTSSDECANDLRCYNSQCRLATNVGSSSCESASSTTLKTCNQACSTSRECSAGLTCYDKACRNPLNTNSTSCAEPTATTTEAMAKSCNEACSSNAECAVNLRCYSGQCRLATNVSSMTCSAATSDTVSSLYKGGNPSDQTATRSGTTSGTTRSPLPKPSIIPQPQVTPLPTAPAESNSALDRIVANLRQRGPQFLLAMMLSGLGLIGLVIVLWLLKKMRTGGEPKKPDRPQGGQPVTTATPPAPVTPQPVAPQPTAAAVSTPAADAHMRRLQDKIDALEHSAPATSAAPASSDKTAMVPPPPVSWAAPKPPTAPMPMSAPRPMFNPVLPAHPATAQPFAPRPMAARPMEPASPAINPVLPTTPTPTPAASPTPPAPVMPTAPMSSKPAPIPAAPFNGTPSSAPSMVDRLKQKGIAVPQPGQKGVLFPPAGGTS